MSASLRRTPAMQDVLSALLRASAPTWGLALSKQTGRPTGTVYPLLERLEQAGHLHSDWDTSGQPGPRRRLYELTPTGRAWATEQLGTPQAHRVETAARAHGLGVQPA